MVDNLSIIVVGAGVTGVSTAEWLRRDGRQVMLLDRVRPGDPAQTSYGNAGLLAASAIIPVSVPGLWRKAPGMLADPMSPLFLRWSYLPRLLPWIIPFLRNGSRRRVGKIAGALATLLHDTVDQHQALARGTPAERFIRTGDYVFLMADRAAFLNDRLTWDLRAAHGYRWEEMDRAAIEAFDAAISTRYRFAIRMLDHGWISDPGAYVRSLFEWFEGQGGAFREGEATDIAPLADGRAVVTVAGERLEADRVVIATGAWSARLAAGLGHRAALETERGYHLTFKNPSVTLSAPLMVSDLKFAVTPMDTGLRVAGLVEFGGLEAPPSKAPINLLKSRITEVLPDLDWDSVEEWQGHRPSTVDSLPLIGPSPKAPGVVFAFGAQHVGLTAGPKTGRWVADLIAGRAPNVDLAPFRVGRFD